MANRHMKRCSALLLSRKRQINTARRYHLRPIRMAIIRQLINDMLERVWREGNPLTMLGAHKLVHPLWKTAGQCLKISKNRVSMWSNNASPEHRPGNIIDLEKIDGPYVHRANLTIAKTWEQPNCPSRDEWIQKMYILIHTENGHHSDI